MSRLSRLTRGDGLCQTAGRMSRLSRLTRGGGLCQTAGRMSRPLFCLLDEPYLWQRVTSQYFVGKQYVYPFRIPSTIVLIRSSTGVRTDVYGFGESAASGRSCEEGDGGEALLESTERVPSNVSSSAEVSSSRLSRRHL